MPARGDAGGGSVGEAARRKRIKRNAYGQSLPNSVNPHIATPAEVNRTRRRNDPVVNAIRSTKADVEALLTLFRLNVGPGGYTGGRPTHESSVAPLTFATTMGKSVAKDFTDPSNHKVNLLLDLLSVGSLGASGAARGVQAGRAAKEGRSVMEALRTKPVPSDVLPRRLLPDNSGQRKLRADGGEIQIPQQSRNLVTGAAEHAFDRLSERVPGLPGLGARARIAHRLPELQATRQLRATEKAIPLALAAKKLRGFRGTTPAEAAYNVVADYGHYGDEGVRLLDVEVNRRKALIASRQMTGKNLELQQNRIKLLEAARPLVQNPSEDLLAATTLGKQATEVTTAMKAARRNQPLSDAAALDAPTHHIRLTHGAEYVAPTDARAGVVSPAVERQRAEVARLQRVYDRSEIRDATAKGIGAKMQGDLLPTHLGGRGQSPITMRLGAALSVQKDKLERLERAAAKRVQKTGIVGADYAKPGPLGFFTSDREQKQRLNLLFRRKRSLTEPNDRNFQRTGATFLAARNELGPTVTLKNYLREVGRSGQTADHDLAISFSRPFNPETDAHLVEQGKLELLNPERKTIPRDELASVPEVELEGLTPKMVAERLLEERTDWVKHVFPDAAKLSDEHRLGLRVVDPKIANAIKGLDLYQAATVGKVAKAFDFTNALNRTALVYLNPAYGPVQRTANYGYLALQQGAFAPANLVQGARQIAKASPELLHWIDLEVGGGAAQSLLHEGTTVPFLHPQEKLADVQNMLADRGPRRQAWIHEAKQEGFKTVKDWERLRDDPNLEGKLNVISERAQQAIVKFRRTPTKTRRMLARAIFILPWIEGSTRYVGRLALDRPITARLTAEIRDRIKTEQHRILKGGETAVRGFTPYAALGALGVPGVSHLGTAGSNLAGMSPTSTPADLAAIAQGLLSGHPVAPGLRAVSLLQPNLTAGIEAATGLNTYTGNKYPSDYNALDILKENLLGTGDRPVTGIGNVIATALRHPEAPSGPALHQPAYLPEGGLRAAAERAFFGSARKRIPNVPADVAKAQAQERSNMSPEQRASDDGKKMLSDLTAQARETGIIGKNARVSPVVVKAVRLRTQRYMNYARKGAKTQPEKFLADVQDLVARKKIPASNLAIAKKFLASNPTSDEVSYQRGLLGKEFYGSDVLEQARAEIKSATERKKSP